MVRSEKKHRIIFIDLMRALAVIQMVQGHTVDVLLAPQYRLDEYPVYFLWNFMRGMTAPIFMFTSGTVFAYLFRLAPEPFEQNPRVFKGIKRFFLLVGLGYLLRYPTYKIFDFSGITQDRWDIFFTVDVLQLIGFGLLFILICAYLAEKLKLSDTLIFSVVTFIFFASSPFIYKINFIEYFPLPIAAYFNYNTGSLFPLFPWTGYVVMGGVLGTYLAKNPLVFKTNRFSFNLAVFGIALIIISAASIILSEEYFGIPFKNNPYDLGTITFRVGFVLLLNSVVSYISQKIESIPKIIILVGRNTLLIYIVHLIILFGSAWNPGIILLFGSSLNVTYTVAGALAMIILMILMVVLFNKLKFRNKELVT